MANINIGGLVSGIDPDNIIEAMMKIQQNQLDLQNVKKTSAETKKTAYQSIQTQLLTLRTTATALAGTSNNPFDARMVQVSSAESLVATASARANAGTYQVKIHSLASAHTVASQSVSNPDSAITQGTFSIRVGNGAQADIVIDDSNDSLSGLADSINFANVGVTASIVQNGTNSYRLMLTGNKTGEANEITITNNLAASSGNAVKPEFDFDNPVQAAKDAVVSLGDGPGAISASSSTNTVTNLISGVTLNLQAADPAKSISVTVAADSEKATKAVTDFVAAYNSFLDFIDEITKYDSESDVGAVLQGDYSVVNIRKTLQTTIQSIVPEMPSKANRLSALGITTSDTGRLTVNETRLQEFIKGNVDGVTTSDLRQLFAVNGKSTTGGITFVYASGKTSAPASPIQVNVTQAAERASLTGGTAVQETTLIDGSNNSLRINLDGVEETLTLKEGTYTRNELASHVQEVINGHSGFAGRSVRVGLDGANQLSINSESYGSVSRLTIYASSAVTALGFNGGESTIGKDVAGEFIIDGKVEQAKGNGRILTGNEDNTFTAELQVRVSLNASQVTSGVEGSITLTRGVASRMNAAIDQLLDGERGILTTKSDQFSAQIESIEKQIARQQAMFDKQKENLLRQFQAMETAIQSLQTTGNLIGAQLSGISKMSS